MQASGKDGQREVEYVYGDGDAIERRARAKLRQALKDEAELMRRAAAAAAGEPLPAATGAGGDEVEEPAAAPAAEGDAEIAKVAEQVDQSLFLGGDDEDDDLDDLDDDDDDDEE